VIPFLFGAFAGAALGFLTAALVRGGHDCDCQVPTLGAGTWIVGIDEHGELARCEQFCHVEARVKRTCGEDRS
jgi:hypothetical protein